MPPNNLQPNQDNNPSVQPNVPQIPQIPQAPQIQQAPTAPVAQPLSTLEQFNQQQSAMYQSGSQKKSGKKWIIALVIGLVLLPIIGLAALVFMLVLPKLQARSVSTSFMSAMSQGNTAQALSYTDGSEDTKHFLEGMVASVKGANYVEKDTTDKNGTWYFLYDLSGSTGDSNSARTELKKENGKLQITGFYAGNNLALIAKESSNDGPSTDSSSAGSAGAASQCLVQSDFDNWYKNMYGGQTATEAGFKFHDPTYMYTTNVHFPADSLDYSSDMTGAVENIANLANDPAVKGKKFMVMLYGSVGTSQADADFGQKRAEVIKKDLVAAGVPADKIAYESAGSVDDMMSSDQTPDRVDKSMARVVVLKFDPTCSGGSNNNGR